LRQFGYDSVLFASAEAFQHQNDFEKALPDLTRLAFDDPSGRSNPRMPLMSELSDLFWSAYKGRGLTNEARKSQRRTA